MDTHLPLLFCSVKANSAPCSNALQGDEMTVVPAQPRDREGKAEEHTYSESTLRTLHLEIFGTIGR